MEIFIFGVIGWFVLIGIITTIYRLIKFKSLHNYPIGKVVLWSLILSCLATIPRTISYLTRPSLAELLKEETLNQEKFNKELETVSMLMTKNIFLNNSPNYDINDIARIKKSPLYNSNFKLYWRAYFIYFHEDLDSSLIEKTKIFGQKRNEVESKMLGKLITQNDLDKINKIHNDIVYEHKVFIRNKYYTDKEYIDNIIRWHFYYNDEKEYGLKIFN